MALLTKLALLGAIAVGPGVKGGAGRARAATAFPQHITVGANPTDIVFDGRTRRAFVVNMGPSVPSVGSVSVVDADTGTLLRTIAAGLSPYAATVAPIAGRIFVSNENRPPAGGTISMLDAASGAMLRTIAAGPVPYALPDERTGRVFVLDESGTLAMRDISSGAFIQSTRVPGVTISSAAMALDEQNGRLFVVGSRPSTVREFDGRTLRLLRTFTLPSAQGDAQTVLVDPGNNRLVVVSYLASKGSFSYSASAITTFALDTGQLVRVAPSQFVEIVQEDAHSGHLFVASQEQSAQSGKLTVFDVRNGVALRVLPNPLGAASIAIDAQRSLVFVAHEGGGIAVYNSASGSLLRTLPATGLLTLGVDEATGRLFAADSRSGVVTAFGPTL